MDFCFSVARMLKVKNNFDTMFRKKNLQKRILSKKERNLARVSAAAAARAKQAKENMPYHRVSRGFSSASPIVQTKANGFRKRLPLERFDPNVAFTAPPSKRETGTRQGLTPVSGWGAATKNAPHLKEKDEERKNAFMDFQCAMLQ